MADRVASLDAIALPDANTLLALWGHRIGPIARPMGILGAHALCGRHGEPVGVAITATLIRERVAGLPSHGRHNTCELARVCASRPHICRPLVRLWREFVLPTLPYRYGVSYQDAGLHVGDLYRHDGWTRCAYSHSGTDSRSGRRGRNKWIWLWDRGYD